MLGIAWVVEHGNVEPYGNFVAKIPSPTRYSCSVTGREAKEDPVTRLLLIVPAVDDRHGDFAIPEKPSVAPHLMDRPRQDRRQHHRDSDPPAPAQDPIPIFIPELPEEVPGEQHPRNHHRKQDGRPPGEV